MHVPIVNITSMWERQVCNSHKNCFLESSFYLYTGVHLHYIALRYDVGDYLDNLSDGYFKLPIGIEFNISYCISVNV